MPTKDSAGINSAELLDEALWLGSSKNHHVAARTIVGAGKNSVFK